MLPGILPVKKAFPLQRPGAQKKRAEPAPPAGEAQHVGRARAAEGAGIERGHRAVSSNDENVDPIGACVGPKGQRVAGIVEELRGEKVDIIPWSPDFYAFAREALKPAQVEELREALPDTYIHVVYGEDTLEGGWRKVEEYFNMRDAMHMYYMTDAGDTVVYNPYTGERSQYEWTNPFR